jgi:Cft2 family RNA processing exonuclease
MPKPEPIQITNLNPDSDIGASSWLVQMDGHRLLLDAGTHPRREGRAGLPLFKAVHNETVDAIAISHCHLDHVGALPVALKYFPHARVLMPDLSYFLVERVLHNSVNVMTRRGAEAGVSDYPLYTHEEVDDYGSVFQGVPYRREIAWADKFGRSAAPTLEFFDAGHTLGSAGVQVRSGKRTVFYSGDVCFHDQTLLRGAQFDGAKADVLILESTRGARELPPGFSRQAELDRLTDCLQLVQKRRGSALIPAFGLGRTQEILAELALQMTAGKLKRQPIYIGGLGRVFTEIYDLLAKRVHRSHPRLKLTKALNLVVVSPKEIAKLSLNESRIFVLTAGMMSENTGAHDLALRLAEHRKHGIFFVGYADPDSPGGRLQAAREGQTIHFSESGGKLTPRCQIENFDLTAHANREDLLDFVTRISPRTVLLGHGGAEARDWMASRLRERHPHLEVLSPGPGERVQASVPST